MAFNLKKFSQSPPSPGDILGQNFPVGNLPLDKTLTNEARQDLQELKNQKPFDKNDLKEPDDKVRYNELYDFETLKAAHDWLFNQGQDGRTTWESLIKNLANQNQAKASTLTAIKQQIESDPSLQSLDTKAIIQARDQVLGGPLGITINQLLLEQKRKSTQMKARTPQGNQFATASTYNKSKTAQLSQQVQQEDAFVSKYIDRLFQSSEQDSNEYNIIKNEILSLVSPAMQEDANSYLQQIQQQENPEFVKDLLAKFYKNYIATGLQVQSSERKTMDLSNQVLNNIKTAANQFGNESYLYGPTEKRICPKLRGKGGGKVGSNDVVSEYICRHHCSDGIVIDDNKTVCGEALWRGNVMDKFSREYVDKDGKITGGYINDRFEVNYNVPEETNMRLKPGEVRKPRPVEIFGNLEARMQAMREKEGEKRGYRPETDTSAPFNWTKDIDQNNMNVAQAERDRREEASGHKLVQYTDKDKLENNPKLPKTASFNLSLHKKAQHNGPEQTGRFQSAEDEDYWMGEEKPEIEKSVVWEGGWRGNDWKCPNCGEVLRSIDIVETPGEPTSPYKKFFDMQKRVIKHEQMCQAEKEIPPAQGLSSFVSDTTTVKKQAFNLSTFNSEKKKIAQLLSDPPKVRRCEKCHSLGQFAKHQNGAEYCPTCGQKPGPNTSFPSFIAGPGATEPGTHDITHAAESDEQIKEAKKKTTEPPYIPEGVDPPKDYNNKEDGIPQKEAKKEKWLQDASEKMKEKGTEGTFTEYCGGKVTQECIEKGKNSPNTKTRQRANFADNARKAFNMQEYKTAAHNVRRMEELYNHPHEEIKPHLGTRHCEFCGYEGLDFHCPQCKKATKPGSSFRSTPFAVAPTHPDSLNSNQDNIKIAQGAANISGPIDFGRDADAYAGKREETNRRYFAPKSVEKETLNVPDSVLSLFSSPEEMEEFFSNLDEEQLDLIRKSIINSSELLNLVKQLKEENQTEVEYSAKALEIDN